MHDIGFDELVMQLSHVIEDRAKALAELDRVQYELKQYEGLKQREHDLQALIQKLISQSQFLTQQITPICAHPFEWRGGKLKNICVLCGRQTAQGYEEEDEGDDYDYE